MGGGLGGSSCGGGRWGCLCALLGGRVCALAGAGSELFWAVGLVFAGLLGCGLGLEVGVFVPFSLASSTVAATLSFRGRPRLRLGGAASSSFGLLRAFGGSVA